MHTVNIDFFLYILGWSQNIALFSARGKVKLYTDINSFKMIYTDPKMQGFSNNHPYQVTKTLFSVVWWILAYLLLFNLFVEFFHFSVAFINNNAKFSLHNIYQIKTSHKHTIHQEFVYIYTNWLHNSILHTKSSRIIYGLIRNPE